MRETSSCPAQRGVVRDAMTWSERRAGLCPRGVALALLLVAFGAGGDAWAEPAQNWPTRPIRAIVPVAPGTGADVVFRLVFNQLSTQLGQQIVVENRGGAGGTIGSSAVAKADPDGYTILANSAGHTIAPAIYPNMNYDVTRDFAAVASFGTDADRAGDGAVKRHHDHPAVRHRGQGKRQFHLRVGRRRIDHASHRRAVPAERRLRGGPRSVQRRRLPARGGVGARRFRVLADCGCGARHPRRPPARARGQQPDARLDAA